MAKNGDYDYDLVTLGAGSGGVRASRLAASAYGARVRTGWWGASLCSLKFVLRVVQPVHLPQEARLGPLAHPEQHLEVIGTLHRPAGGGWHWQWRRAVAAAACCLVPPRSVAPPNQPATASHL
jgi:hypothetical protein